MKYSLSLLLIILFVPAGLASGQTASLPSGPPADLQTPAATGQAVPQATQAVAVQSADLVEKAKLYDGKEVLFEGEAIGDPLARGDHAWVNFLGENYAIGVWMSEKDRATILRYGSYASDGDRVAIRGTFHRACPEHGGDMDIHADFASIISRGKSVTHASPAARLVIAPLLLVLAAFLYRLWKKRESLLHQENGRRPI